jgi:hypothetical protein
MAENRAIAARQDRCHPPAPYVKPRVADRVHASMDDVEPTGVDAITDRPPTETGVRKLLP